MVPASNREVLTDAGFDHRHAVDVFTAVHTYTLGFAALESGRSRNPTLPLTAEPTSR